MKQLNEKEKIVLESILVNWDEDNKQTPTYDKEVKIAVVEQLAGMLAEEICVAHIDPLFVGWCCDGDVFYDRYQDTHGTDFCEMCVDLMNQVSDDVDNLLHKHFKINNYD